MRLPSSRAFLVWLSSDAAPDRGLLCGRVEHVQSGRTARIESPEDLQAFVTLVLSEENSNSDRFLGDGSTETNEN